MIKRIHDLRAVTKYSALSILPIVAVLILHSIHVMAMPLAMGAMEMHTHHHEMASPNSSALSLIPLGFFIFNAISIFIAVKQLWMIRKERKGGWHAYLCSGVSVAALIITIMMTVVV